ncbi:putative xylulose-5-phosphate/fructose-6-phosphate phosphoketolase [Actinoplanes missouriensis 431]|uniref:Putative xylulose-5-phosphate/fructose-6-phosphate phosphoketolase n=1 Tax=Actinoplanes missouriensis (strain ATCC 14538 / DSM 43046 / CBS 188.64 / JCM 3121 / NBRC 102363 / NCIMB 12654 / NRRL B-3342 / UNCC 431) TaxID=512565 RepID=I0H7G6_ACTM4|nr:putative xylulose-5-phosphate/fructose-6-phosphate phosphoketolase [Actinoplanes missouriensis 431]
MTVTAVSENRASALDHDELVRKLAAPDDNEVAGLDAWWRANNYLTIGQIYLQGNPLLKEPLTTEHIKPRLLGHWGTSPGLSFIYAHVSRLIKMTGQQAIYLAGPGHGGPALVAAGYLEGTYSEVYPKVGQDEAGLLRLFRQFSSPGGIPSHVSVTTPGSIHEGGELGYVLVHAFGSVMDNPDLLSIAVVGDGEAETGPLEGSWKGISFINPAHDGAVLPILHLNGAKIAGPTVLARKDPAEVRKLLEGHGYEVIEVGGDDLPGMHHRFAQALADSWGKIRAIQTAARSGDWDGKRPHWPLIVLRTPKGWTGPEKIDGITVTGTWRSHQVPLSGVRGNEDHLRELETWLRSYRPEELFDAAGAPVQMIKDLAPDGDLRMSASPHANGGVLTRDLDLPDFRDYAVDVKRPAQGRAESTRKLGEMMRDIYARNADRFRLFCPDETNSNRLGAVFEVSDRGFMESVTPDDVKISNEGRVMEVLSEHNCHGWLEGYNLTGRHGMFATYEAFAMVSASQTIQHGKWLQEAKHLEWRAKVPSLNILLTSTAWRNDHNGFSHQGPGLIQNVLTQRGDVARVYLPPDANTLLSVADHCFRSRSYINLIVIDKQPQLQWLDMDQAIEHCRQGAGVWEWAGTDDGATDPDIVLACAGDVVTMETVAAAQILKQKLPNLKVRVVNVVDLMTLPRPKDHPHGMSETLFRELFTDHVDVVFSFHGYPGAIHQLVHGRPDADRFRVRGFIEQGTTTTPFDMTVRNRASRYHLVMDAINNARRLPTGATELKAWCEAQLERHERYVVENLEDMPEVRDWSLGDWAEH